MHPPAPHATDAPRRLPRGRKPSGSRALRALGLFALLTAATFRVHGSLLELPFFLDDLVAPALLAPEGAIDGSRVLGVLWPSEEGLAYNRHFRPLGWATIAADAALFGWEPAAFRRSGFLLHALAALLVVGLVRRLAPAASALGALLAGLLFVVHGASVEVLAWPAHRFTLLATVWWLFGAWILLGGPGRRGKPLLTFLIASLALVSKDSMLTEIWPLALIPLLAPQWAGQRRWAWRPLAALGAAVGLSLLLRLLCFGELLPAFESGSASVLASSDLPARIADLPHTLRVLVMPYVQSHERPYGAPEGYQFVTLVVGLVSFCAAAITLGLLGMAGRRAPPRSGEADAAPGAGGLRTTLILLGGLLAAGLPTLRVSDELEGLRRLVIPTALMATALGLASGRLWAIRRPAGRARLGLAALLLLALHLLATSNRHDAYGDAGRLIRGMEAATEALIAEGAQRVLISGWEGPPPSSRGAPVFGRGEHFHLRFRPPLRTPAADAQIEVVPSAQLSGALSGQGEAMGLILQVPLNFFDALSETGRPRLLAPAENSVDWGAPLEVRWPRPNGVWPAPESPGAAPDRIAFVSDGGLHALEIEVGENRFLGLFRWHRNMRALRVAEEDWTHPPSGLHAVAPKLIGPESVAGRLRITRYGEPGEGPSAARSAWIPFRTAGR